MQLLLATLCFQLLPLASPLHNSPYNTFDYIRVKLSLRVPKPSPRTQYDWKAFSSSPDLQARYTVEVRNCFQLLAVEEEPNTMCGRFVFENMEASRICQPVMKRIGLSPRSRHPEVVAAHGKVEEA